MPNFDVQLKHYCSVASDPVDVALLVADDPVAVALFAKDAANETEVDDQVQQVEIKLADTPTTPQLAQYLPRLKNR